ncbi:RNA polymerase sigma factor [Spirochaeta isovalerica]|uniref:RNA polymerase sigma-70 factor (ECF subfamily) n=1 Tax=Spirochaeta isovalerica TaxID=150 RepID=A0A841R8T6_9SPIO|nr:sigma-70 family RNA polymerase sigma factor [Spirochaeta isovalerica]MBB6479369.1 RNA polymerase sigma-70 factor (ECF subfamily) [Spirochaeta isovalerica]
MSEDLYKQVLNYEGKITRFFLSKQLSREEVEDLSQEVLCRIYESLHSFRGSSSPGTWIYAICRNVLFEFMRKQNRIQVLGERDIPVPDKTEYIDFTSLVDNLPGYLKPVYSRRFRENLSIREIARELNMAEGTVKYYLFIIKKYLRNMVQ